MKLDRTDQSFLAHWWWTVDRVMLFFLALIMLFGVVLIMAASPPVAERIGLHSFHFVTRHMIFLTLAVVTIILCSMISPVALRRLAFIGFAACFVLLILVPMLGAEVKGAKRWIYIAGFSLQPSEFMKPLFVLVTAWIFTLRNTRRGFPGYTISLALALVISLLLMLEPDFSMMLMTLAVWSAQIFIAGLHFFWIALVAVLFLLAIIIAYIYFPYVASRINMFLDPASGNDYQMERSLQAMTSGGIFGQGPGEGIIKNILPDSHTDFIFAVAGEELGLLACLGIVLLYACVIVRGFQRIYGESDLFIIYSVSGLLVMFGLQAFVHMGVVLGILPNTGMTLPFISYGGSSMLATAVTMGLVLAMTRRRYGVTRKQAIRT